MVKRFVALGLLGAMLMVLLAFPLGEVSAQAATATVTYTPIATRVATTYTSYALPSGTTLNVENTATMGETLALIAIICVLAVMGIRFVYELAYQWGK